MKPAGDTVSDRVRIRKARIGKRKIRIHMIDKHEISLLLANEDAANILEKAGREYRWIRRNQVIATARQLCSQSLNTVQ